ncbi:hypothetical protein LK07_02715 [Streptomyces pluripotens]|uniref:Integral membrane protein n=1 Tax=Streptomyces pluripotens TaxID=1355015 RepID=A0A221P8P7_9ACTN|nr:MULTISPECIES: hypothetical protein [Streptomyces]ASN28155.1 hypothetical protein LK07_02715 [Streptomyces pluripotens]KIE25864.1 hypothetical protein LK08_17600 [Streptomyces sp. MUSC 125]MCH0556844.1 hypothetical protein [Streptomyces sp. MUM 16J]
MRNKRALAAACAAVAVLGLAAPVAVADGMGHGGGPGNSSDISPDMGSFSGTFTGHFNGNGNANFGDRGRGDDPGRGGDRGNRNDNGGGDRADDWGGRGGDGGPRNIVATPSVIAAGARLTVTVDGCRGGTMSSRAFRTTRLSSSRDDSARGTVTIDRDARPGRYDITVRCDSRSLTRPDAFTVLGGVHGGVGGGTSVGATPADMAIGGGLVASAVITGGAFWLRRRHEKRI